MKIDFYLVTGEFRPFKPKKCFIYKKFKNSKDEEFALVKLSPPYDPKYSSRNKRLTRVLLWNPGRMFFHKPMFFPTSVKVYEVLDFKIFNSEMLDWKKLVKIDNCSAVKTLKDD